MISLRYLTVPKKRFDYSLFVEHSPWAIFLVSQQRSWATTKLAEQLKRELSSSLRRVGRSILRYLIIERTTTITEAFSWAFYRCKNQLSILSRLFRREGENASRSLLSFSSHMVFSINSSREMLIRVRKTINGHPLRTWTDCTWARCLKRRRKTL